MFLTRYFFIVLLFTLGVANSQDQPPILSFSPDMYGADNQNWKINQDADGRVYVANNSGLLEYNGAIWTLYPSPNESIVRAVKVHKERIYTGFYMDFGYWERSNKGILEFTSLTENIKDKLVDDEHFWGIIDYGQWVLFQSLDQIFIYNTETNSFNVISPENGVNKIFKVGEKLFFQSLGKGIFEIENGKQKLVTHSESIVGKRIINIVKSTSETIIITENDGLYILNPDMTVNKKNVPDSGVFDRNTIYSGILLHDGRMALGTIANGLYILNDQGELEQHYKQSNGIDNNTILTLFEDREQNVWLGLDNGINCINLNSPYEIYNDSSGTLGTVYAAVTYNDKLYLGTNQGLFYKPIGKNENNRFEPVVGTEGQVWMLDVIDNTLFCGHNAGTFIITEDQAELISTVEGTWKLKKLNNRDDLLLQGNYNGLNILKKENGQWKFSHKLQGFDYSARHFEVLGDNQIYVSHEYKGIYHLHTDNDLTRITSFEQLPKPTRSKNAGINKYNNTLIYASKDGIYSMVKDTDTFLKDSLLSDIFSQQGYLSGKMVADNSGKLWVFTDKGVSYISSGRLSDKPIIFNIPITSAVSRSLAGYENVVHLGNQVYLFGAKDGYYCIDLDKIIESDKLTRIENVKAMTDTGRLEHLDIATGPELPFDQNNIEFSFAVPQYSKFQPIEYQHRLLGQSERWSMPTAESTVKFENLPYGDYTFEVRTADGATNEANIASYDFIVKRPWHLSNWAIVLYTLGVFALAILVHNIYRSAHKKQRAKLIWENQQKLEIKHLEAEQKIMTIKHEQLKQDIDSKNRELAATTMNLINKNEILAQIKKDLLEKNDGIGNVKSIVKTIDKNISEEDNWNFFKEAFNNADKDFLQKVKGMHPELTPNDLRLCAYLRLNLSSKEIAPLLNITPRSVEIKRYRLRKKMSLAHEESLVEYILAI